MDNASGSQVNENSGKKNSRRSWTKAEEEALLIVLEDCIAKGYRCDIGTFKPDTLNDIEKTLNNLCPYSELKATPHIENRIRILKRQYGIVYDMLNRSGFAWNDIKKCGEVDSNEAWMTYVQHNKDAKGWRDKHFSLYERLSFIFGKDRATENAAETPAEMVQNANQEEDEEVDGESSKSVNQTSSTPNRKKRKRSDSLNLGMSEIATSFQKMFEKSFEQMKMMTDRLVQGNEDRNDIANELREMGLSIEEQLHALTLILEKPQNVATFKSAHGELRVAFVRKILRERAA